MRWMVTTALLLVVTACTHIGEYSSVASERARPASSLIIAVSGLNEQTALEAEQSFCQRVTQRSSLQRCVTLSSLSRSIDENLLTTLFTLADQAEHSHSVLIILSNDDAPASAHRIVVHQHPTRSLVYQAQVETNRISDAGDIKYRDALFKRITDDLVHEHILPGRE